MRRWTILTVSVVGLLLLLVPAVASADVNNFTVTDFSANETLTRADPQGELRITERISVKFNDYNHGILRAIPERYHGHSLKLHINRVSSDSGAPAQYTTSTSNGNEVLKIGDPNRTVTGAQEYTVGYTVDNVIGFAKGYDELYWDVNGDQWEQSFSRVTTVVRLPNGLQLQRAPECYAGYFGDVAAGCVIVGASGKFTVTAPQGVAPEQTLTYRFYFQKGYFTPMTFWEGVADYAKPIIEVLAPMLLVLGISFARWWRLGRDPKGRGTIVPEYAPPDGVSPLDAGTIADFKTDNRDITATFIDLARRGYIRIIENRKDRKILKDQVSYTLELRKSDWSDCTPYESRLLMDTFSGSTVGLTVDLKDLKNRLYKTAKTIRSDLGADLTARGYFRKNPAKFFVGIGSGVIAIVIILLQILGPIFKDLNLVPLAFGLGGAVIIWLLFELVMPARTVLGVATKESLRGLKLYMETAEKDRLEKLEGPEAAYATGAGEPQRTVELFEKLLPYAIVLQVENQWAAKFNDIYTSAPDWYVGNWTAFNAGYLAGSLNSGFASAINTSFSAPSSAGVGGGGFAGGGGGGGGGGGW